MQAPPSTWCNFLMLPERCWETFQLKNTNICYKYCDPPSPPFTLDELDLQVYLCIILKTKQERRPSFNSCEIKWDFTRLFYVLFYGFFGFFLIFEWSQIFRFYRSGKTGRRCGWRARGFLSHMDELIKGNWKRDKWETVCKIPKEWTFTSLCDQYGSIQTFTSLWACQYLVFSLSRIW